MLEGYGRLYLRTPGNAQGKREPTRLRPQHLDRSPDKARRSIPAHIGSTNMAGIAHHQRGLCRARDAQEGSSEKNSDGMHPPHKHQGWAK